MRKMRQSQEGGARTLIKPITTCSLVGAVVSGGLLLLLAFLLSIKDMPHAAIEPMALAAAIIGCVSAGFLCARLVRRRGMILGALCGLGLFGILSLAGFATVQPTFDTGSLIKLVIYILAGAVGGVLGVNAKTYRK